MLSQSATAPQCSDVQSCIKQFVEVMAKGDTVDLKQFINNTGSVYLIRRDGADLFEELKLQDFQKFVSGNAFHFAVDSLEAPVKTRVLPQFDCDSERWSANGIFYNMSFNDGLLSRTIDTILKYVNPDLSGEIVRKARAVERKSFKVVVAPKNTAGYGFYLIKENNRWKVSIVEVISGDCGT